MDRGRRAAATARRKPLAHSVSPHSTPEISPDHPSSPSTPISMSGPTASPQTAPPHARRPSRPAAHLFSFSSPNPVRPPTAKRRAQPLESLACTDDQSVAHGSPQKGGHSLRKRARVDYTLEHIDDDPMAPASSTASSAARSKKRRPELAEAPEHANGPQALPKKPGNSLAPDAASGLRRNPARKGAEPRAYRHDDDVKDTIEVGVSFAHPSRPEHPQSGHSPPDTAWSLAALQSRLSISASAGRDTRQPMAALPADIDVAAPSAPHASTACVSDQAGLAQSPQPAECCHAPGFGDSASSSVQDTQQAVAAADLATEKTSSPPWSTTDGPNHHPTAQVSSPAPRHGLIRNQEQDSAQPHEEHSSTHDLLPDDSAADDSADDRRSQSDPALPAALVETEEQHGTKPQPPSQDSTALEAEEGLGNCGKWPPKHGATKPAAIGDAERGQQPLAKSPNTTPLDAPRAPSDSSVPQAAETSPGPLDGGTVLPISPTDEHPALRNPSIQPPEDYRDDAGDERCAGPRDYKVLLSTYVENEYELYPGETFDKDEDADEVQGEGRIPDIKDESNHADGPQPTMEQGNSAAAEAATPAVETPAQDSPTSEAVESTAADSPNATASEDNDDVPAAGSHDIGQRPTLYRFRKIRNPADFLEILKNHKTMSTEELTEVLAVVNESIKDLFDEYQKEKWMVEDYEHSLKRRDSDEKYENRTQDLNNPSTSFEEPDFVIRGSRAIQNSKDRAAAAESRRVQDWDRVISSQYGFPYVDQQVVKVNGQDVAVPNGDVEGVVTRQRARGGVKAAEAAQEPGRDKTPAAGKTGRKMQKSVDAPKKATSRPAEPAAVGEGTVQDNSRKRKRGALELVSSQAEESAASTPEEIVDQDESAVMPDCKRVNKSPKKHRQGTRLLTLKLNPMAMKTSEVCPAMKDNGSSRPSSSSSDSTSHTAESAYSFRPKRQKRFFDEPGHESAEATPAKRIKRPAGQGAATTKDGGVGDKNTGGAAPPAEAAASPLPPARKIAKIKVVSKARNGTPVALPPCVAGTDERPKDYKSMTKSEKMSASMKSRWANGNMAGAVEKRKATLAAKKAAQVAADQKVGTIVPNPAKAKSCKKETAAHNEQQSPESTGSVQHKASAAGSSSSHATK